MEPHLMLVFLMLMWFALDLNDRPNYAYEYYSGNCPFR